MKHYKDAIIHGAQLFRHLKGQQTSDNDNELVLAKLSFAAARIAARTLRQRAAVEEGAENEDDFFSSSPLGEDQSGSEGMFSAFFGGGNDEDNSGVDFFSAFLGGGNDEPEGGGDDMFSSLGLGLGDEDGGFAKIMENVEQCGIDGMDMVTKAMGAIPMGGSDFDMSSPESFLGLDTFGPILLALKDDDENECSATENAMLLLASENYAECSGINEFFNVNDMASSGVLLESVEDACKPVLETLFAGDMLSLLQDDESSKRCLQTILGDNVIGNLIRYEISHIDKIFGCFSKLSEDLPHCVLSVPAQDGKSISFPLSLAKKETCVLGSSYGSFMEEACVSMYEGLDKCLPQVHSTTNVDETTSLCAVEEGLMVGKQDDLFGMDASVLTDNKMPDFCSGVFKEMGMDAEDLQPRLDYYNKNREYGWTISSTTIDVKDEVDQVPDPLESEDEDIDDPDPEEYVTLYKSTSVGIPSAKHSAWTDGEGPLEDDVSSQKEYFLFLVVGLGIAATALLVLIVKTRGFGSIPTRSHSTPNNTNRKNYANVSVKMDGLEGCEIA